MISSIVLSPLQWFLSWYKPHDQKLRQPHEHEIRAPRPRGFQTTAVLADMPFTDQNLPYWP